MARPKKVTQKEDALLTPEQVWDVIEFADSLMRGVYPGMVTPDLINSRMKDISFNPLAATDDSLARALQNPKESESDLRSFIENFEIISMPFKRILSYMASHLAFDLTYVCQNAKSIDDYKSPAYKKSQDTLFDFLDSFEYKAQFKNVTKQLLRNEIYVCAVRDEGEKIVLQELPIEYTKITAKWDYGFLAAFNFVYFLQPGVDIELFPRFFREKFATLFKDANTQTYNPAISLDQRGNSQYVYWVDLPPEVGWVFKFDTSLTAAVPYFTGLMPDLIQQPVMRALQKNINMSTASRMLVGQVPLLKDSKSKMADMIAVDPDTLGKFLSLVKSALSEAIKVTAAPLEQISGISFPAENTMYDDWMRTSLASSGMNTALFYTSNLKANMIESQLSFQSDSLIMEQLYSQFNNFMNYFGNRRKAKSKFKFGFEFEGNEYYLDRQQRLQSATELANLGIVLPQKIAAAKGIKPQNFIRMMEESKGMGFTDLLTPIIMASQQSGASGSNGRPAKTDSQLSDAGEQSRSDGSNVAKGGKV